MSQSAGANLASTIVKAFSLSGGGLHSGNLCTIKFKPAYEVGIFFRFGGKIIPALAENVTSTERGTNLSSIHTVEHLLAAIKGVGIDCMEIEISSEEVPIMDGSALPFVEALKKSGKKLTKKSKNIFSVKDPFSLRDKDSSIEVLPWDGFEVDFMVNFPFVGDQNYYFKHDFENEIAPARTFGYVEELEALKRKGLAKGASLENALVLSSNGYVNTPRFENELVRHKILDLMGDLALAGMDIKAKIIARKSGHKLNVMLAKKLRDDIKKQGGSQC